MLLNEITSPIVPINPARAVVVLRPEDLNANKDGAPAACTIVKEATPLNQQPDSKETEVAMSGYANECDLESESAVGSEFNKDKGIGNEQPCITTEEVLNEMPQDDAVTLEEEGKPRKSKELVEHEEKRKSMSKQSNEASRLVLNKTTTGPSKTAGGVVREYASSDTEGSVNSDPAGWRKSAREKKTGGSPRRGKARW